MTHTSHDLIIESLTRRHSELTDALQPLAAAAANTGERVVNLDAHRSAGGGKIQLTVELARVQAALARHAKGKFGLCCACELDVESERMASEPTAAFCEACFEEVAEARRRQGYLVR